MNLRTKLMLILSSIGLGALIFISYIAYQSIGALSTIKQQELLKAVSEQILLNHPDSSANSSDWKGWIKNNQILKSSKFSIFIHKRDAGLLLSNAGSQSSVDMTYAKSLSKALISNDLQDHSALNHELQYVWYRSAVPETPYTMVTFYASHPEKISFYFRRMGVPLLIATGLILWFSFWAAVILANLFQRLADQKKNIEHQAMHDPLTGLPNRNLLADRLDHAFSVAKRDGICFALCMLDMDRFKEVNDTLGHEYGDKLLIEVAKRSKSVLREADTVARLGGDEFAIILHYANRQRATTIANRISKILKTEFLIEGKKFNTSGSLGIAIYPEHGISSRILMKHADLAMYRAKQQNNDFAFYNPEQISVVKNTLFLFTDLVEAVDNKNFEIHYQPKFDISEQRVTGIEALLRWKHPTKGLISPGVFIPLAEQTGLIRNISRWVLRQSISDQMKLKKKGIDLAVAVNLSVYDLDNNNICEYITSLVSEFYADSSKIIIEVTESAMMFNPDVTNNILNDLDNKGFVISIDDFGTGYSYLSNLQRLHIGEIKIDQSFVSNLDENENNLRIVRATIGLAHDLDIKVVAEGVESSSVLSMLTDLRCDIVQGYEVCKPLPLEQLEKQISLSGQIKPV